MLSLDKDDHSDLYWRLRHGDKATKSDLESELKAAGYGLTTASKSLLLAQANRVKRGFTVRYQFCTLAELNGFAKARKLSKSKYHHQQVMRLAVADDQRTFPKFLQLPPEIRNLVYHFHFAAMPRKLRTCSQPPIARTSTQLRSEALSLFYSTKCIELHFRRVSQGGRHVFRPRHETDLFLGNVPDTSLLSLRHIDLRFERSSSTCSWFQPYATESIVHCDVTINPSASAFNTTVSNPKKVTARQQKCDAAKVEVDKILERACARESGKGLRSIDIYMIRGVIERYFG